MNPTLIQELRKELAELDRKRAAINLLLEGTKEKPKKVISEEKVIEKKASKAIKTAKKRKPLTEQEISTITRMANNGKTTNAIATHINRSFSMVKNQLDKMRAVDPQVAMAA